MKYDLTAKVFYITFSKMFKKFYHLNYPNIDSKSILKKTKLEYKNMILRTPGLAKGNYLEPNLIIACFIFSLAKNDSNMNPEIMDSFIAYCLSTKLMKNINLSKKNKGTIFNVKEQDKRVEDGIKSQSSKYEMDWIFDYTKGNNEFWCKYTKCGICTLAKKENMEEYISCLCKMDYKNFKLMGGNLTRTKTLANGDDCCDFHVTRM